MGNFNLQKLNLTPTEGALARAAEDINVELRSRAHLLAIIDGLDLDKTPRDTKMIYVLAMLNLGFTKSRALARMKITNSQFLDWKKDEENETRLDECESRGEMILEETLLLAAESDPKIAMAVLGNKDKVKSKEQEENKEKVKRVEDFFYEGLKERGLIQEGEITPVKEGPSELE